MPEDDYKQYKDWENKQNSKWNSISKQVKPIHIILGIALIFVANYYTKLGKISPTFFYAIIIGLVILIVYLLYRAPTQEKLIPEHIIKRIAYESLERKRMLGEEIPFDCKIRVTLVGECVYEHDMLKGLSGIVKREVGFEIIRKGYRKTGVIGIHPYTGDVMGLRWERLGYSGKETKDRTIVPVGVVNKLDNPLQKDL